MKYIVVNVLKYGLTFFPRLDYSSHGYFNDTVAWPVGKIFRIAGPPPEHTWATCLRRRAPMSWIVFVWSRLVQISSSLVRGQIRPGRRRLLPSGRDQPPRLATPMSRPVGRTVTPNRFILTPRRGRPISLIRRTVTDRSPRVHRRSARTAAITIPVRFAIGPGKRSRHRRRQPTDPRTELILAPLQVSDKWLAKLNERKRDVGFSYFVPRAHFAHFCLC